MSRVAGPHTARAQARVQMLEQIKREALAQLAAEGAPGLSLRQIARELGLVSSGLYRYFASRDELLTALIVDAYDAVGAAAEAALAANRRRGAGARWLAVSQAIRAWALAHPHEYALIYGSPVPGYAAPPDTIDPASRVAFTLLRIVVDGVAAGEIAAGDDAGGMPRAVHADFAQLRAAAAPGVPDAVLARSLLAWSQLFGSISLEMFGHLHNVIHDSDAYFTAQMRRAAEFLVTGV